MRKDIRTIPEVKRRMAELVRIARAALHAWEDDSITDRVKLARLRLLMKDGRKKLLQLEILGRKLNKEKK